jgi:hypothetical protein
MGDDRSRRRTLPTRAHVPYRTAVVPVVGHAGQEHGVQWRIAAHSLGVTTKPFGDGRHLGSDPGTTCARYVSSEH